jgi:hypothetical protein
MPPFLATNDRAVCLNYYIILFAIFDDLLLLTPGMKLWRLTEFQFGKLRIYLHLDLVHGRNIEAGLPYFFEVLDTTAVFHESCQIYPRDLQHLLVTHTYTFDLALISAFKQSFVSLHSLNRPRKWIMYEEQINIIFERFNY